MKGLLTSIALILAQPSMALDDPAGWARDFDALHQAIVEIHPAAMDTPALSTAVDNAKQQLPGWSPARAALEVQRILALLNDGHTELAATPASLRGHWLPLIFRRFEEGWFVRTGDPGYRALYGRPVVTVAGRPIQDVVALLEHYVAGDNPLGKLDGIGNLMRNTQVLAALGIVDDPGTPIAFGVLGDDQLVRVSPSDDGWVQAHWRDLDQVVNPGVAEPLYRALDGNYACAWLPDHRLLYVLFNEIRDEDEGPSIAEFFGSVYRFAEKQGPEKFVLDLRENSGGNLDLNGPVFHGLLGDRNLNQPGRSFVIIGRDTYSAAMNLAVLLERHSPVIFVGEPTGATPNHYGDTRVVALPHSQIRVEISELAWQDSDPRDHRPWIAPEWPVAPSVAAFLAGRDMALEAVLASSPGDSGPPHLERPMARWRRPGQPDDWPNLQQSDPRIPEPMANAEAIRREDCRMD